jgi:hypothetical protein
VRFRSVHVRPPAHAQCKLKERRVALRACGWLEHRLKLYVSPLSIHLSIFRLPIATRPSSVRVDRSRHLIVVGSLRLLRLRPPVLLDDTSAYASANVTSDTICCSTKPNDTHCTRGRSTTAARERVDTRARRIDRRRNRDQRSRAAPRRARRRSAARCCRSSSMHANRFSSDATSFESALFVSMVVRRSSVRSR